MVVMTVKRTDKSPTEVTLSVSADAAFLKRTKDHVLNELAPRVTVAGFRKGKVPMNLVEKNVDQTLLSTEFLDHAVNELYSKALAQENLRPIANPQIELKKFVPFTTVEFEATVEVIGPIKLGDYKKIKMSKPAAKVEAKEVDEVIQQLLTRAAEKKEVKRVSKDGDEVVIDFKGVDAKTKEPINGGEGKAYPLVLGSNSFIPGFEDNVVGMKAGETKDFTLTFPKDYSVATLQSRKVTFTVTVTQVQELVTPKLDDAFAATLGPVKTVKELKDDVKRQLEQEKQQQVDRDFENELVQKIADQATVAIPKVLIEEQITAAEDEERRNLTYRGQTWEEHLAEEGKTAEEHREDKRPIAEQRVKAGLVLSQIAEDEKIFISPEELDIRMQILSAQYSGDPQMKAELAKEETRRDMTARMLTEKTIAKLSDYATGK